MLLYASGGILFASSCKKYVKNAAQTKVLDSFAVDKQVFSKTVAKCRIVSASTVASADSRPLRGRQSGHFLETASLHPPLAALRRFPAPLPLML